jgi:predicted nucleic acid-binding protein
LLDTSVVSDAVKATPSPKLAEWLQSQRDVDLFLSTVTLAEIDRGIQRLESGKRRSALEAWAFGESGLLAIFAGRVLAFDIAAAREWARFMAQADRSGRPRPAIDTQIAGIASANDCTVVTRNVRHFEGIVPVLDPAQPAD